MELVSALLGNIGSTSGQTDCRSVRADTSHRRIAEIAGHEGDEPDPLADLSNADVLPGKHGTQIHLPALKTDAAATGHGDRLIMEGGYHLGMPWQERVSVNPAVRSGKPCIKGTRITVYDVLEWR